MVVFKHYTDIKRTQMSAQTTIASKTFKHHRRKNKIFHDKTSFHQYLATNPLVHKILDRKLQHKEDDYTNKNIDN